ncbi:hypothetical protein [Nocardia sp. NPDC056000]|uniref:hypothetical protein n=1 Tax=Nocardia sp. NPDC056000 TaxID=3345674 RepID=UPI0035D881A1
MADPVAVGEELRCDVEIPRAGSIEQAWWLATNTGTLDQIAAALTELTTRVARDLETGANSSDSEYRWCCCLVSRADGSIVAGFRGHTTTAQIPGILTMVSGKLMTLSANTFRSASAHAADSIRGTHSQDQRPKRPSFTPPDTAAAWREIEPPDAVDPLVEQPTSP